MNRPPTAAATASAARASFLSTLTPSGVSAKARRISAATAVTPATVAASTRPAANGASPKFSTSSASIPPSTSACASARAASITRPVERGAEHPRSDEQEELGLLDQPILEAEEVAEDRDVLQERNATVGDGDLVLDEAAEDERLIVDQHQRRLGLTLDDGQRVGRRC